MSSPVPPVRLAIVPPLNLNESTPVPPLIACRLSNVSCGSVTSGPKRTEPPAARSSVHVLSVFPTVSEFTPPAPPLTDPVTSPPLNTKLSFAAPPTRFSISLKVKSPTCPPFTLVMVQALLTSRPTNVSFPPIPLTTARAPLLHRLRSKVLSAAPPRTVTSSPARFRRLARPSDPGTLTVPRRICSAPRVASSSINPTFAVTTIRSVPMPPSSVSPLLNTGTLESLTSMAMIDRVLPSTTFSEFERLIRNVSAPSFTRSPGMSIRILAVVLPGANVSVPEVSM